MIAPSKDLQRGVKIPIIGLTLTALTSSKRYELLREDGAENADIQVWGSGYLFENLYQKNETIFVNNKKGNSTRIFLVKVRKQCKQC